MPQDVCFFLPFAARTNPEAERARERHLDWAVGHGLVRGAAAIRRYRAWRLTDLAAYAYPDVTGEDLDLVTDAVCLGFPLDDQVGGPPRLPPERTAWLTTELAAIPYRVPGTAPRLDLPLTRAYADVWQRCAAGMSPWWRERAARNLTRFFRSCLQEAQNRHLGVRLREDDYIELRRQAVGTAPCFDLIERAGHCEVPAAAYWSREMRAMTRYAGDVVFLCNDVHSAEREEADGDPHNLVLIRQRDLGCSRAEAIGQVAGLVRDRVEAFLRVAATVPDLHADWRLDARGAAAVERYLGGLRAWMIGNQLWGVASARYAPNGEHAAPGVLPGAAVAAGAGVPGQVAGAPPRAVTGRGSAPAPAPPAGPRHVA
ncbi:terpene synthase family protein [Streptomyces sp. SBT349]|uniref:terpene synthase family protein n=1 Tax=Streptomyces sp. SBT349 TaxID=1580539 RepID=UPI00066CAD3B|nr:hypothetical protein [Streptomyces sp. SBT349]